MKYFVIILFLIGTVSCDSSKDLAETHTNKTKMTDPVLIHTAFFWIKEGTSEKDVQFFEEGLVRLGTCPQIQNFHWGPPAPTEARGVVDNTYDYAINVHFKSLEDQAEYQKEPIHLKFIEDHQDIWGKVIVYDTTVK